ncbi:methyltransferase domain-containing protein [Nonomuraea terrae]|uniref:class I SAM-dependent methyltransferase n=1 Tax=Nonomuraea terrae TaxID=2530383 RepID=UPI0037B5DCE9
MQETTSVDQARLAELIERIITDAGAAVAFPLALVGDRLGVFSALAAADGPVTAEQLAGRTGLAERYLREWLLAMAAAGYVTYAGGGDPGPEAKRTARYRLSPEQAEAFTNSDSPGYVAGVFQNLTAATRMVDRITEVFRTGEGISWHEQHDDMFEGTERFFRPSYLANLTSSWIPSLSGIEERLDEGARVADVGCGFGTSTIIMAKAYPNSTFVGLDSHDRSIARARERAAGARVADRVTFRAEGATDLHGTYDLIAFFDCLHDMPDPVAALRAARPALTPGGRVMLVEPMSWDTVEETVGNPLGRLLAGASTFVCLPSGLAGPPAYGLGAQAGPARILQVAEEAGFGDARVALATETNRVFELAP